MLRGLQIGIEIFIANDRLRLLGKVKIASILRNMRRYMPVTDYLVLSRKRSLALIVMVFVKANRREGFLSF